MINSLIGGTAIVGDEFYCSSVRIVLPPNPPRQRVIAGIAIINEEVFLAETNVILPPRKLGRRND